jgi:hypothetical protein
MKHRDAYPEDGRSPTLEEYLRSNPDADHDQPRRIIVAQPSSTAADAAGDIPHDILIVASKLKDYVRVKSGLYTSQNVLGKLSDIVRRHVDSAIANAQNDGRKTVMDRDF